MTEHLEFKVKRIKLFERSLPEHRWNYGILPPVPAPKIERNWRLKEAPEPASL